MKRHDTHVMWGYQEHFRTHIKVLGESAMELMGVDDAIDAVLIGLRAAPIEGPPVCLVSEGKNWTPDIFFPVRDAVEACGGGDPWDRREVETHSRQDTAESLSMQRLKEAVGDILHPQATARNMRPFCGTACRIGEYLVLPVMFIAETAFEKHPPIVNLPRGGIAQTPYASLIHACFGVLLDEACSELCRPEPGRNLAGGMRNAREIVRIAARNFMHTLGMATNEHYTFNDLFNEFNVISSLMYEGAEGYGKLLLASSDNPAVDYLVRFVNPVPLSEHRWARKILQMASGPVSIVADASHIYGLGKISAEYDPAQENIFEILFNGHFNWKLKCGLKLLLQSKNGEPQMPADSINRELFLDNYLRLFPTAQEAHAHKAWQLLQASMTHGHGTTIIIADDARSEARRLSNLGTEIAPLPMDENILRTVSAIDGAILMDCQGVCHGIGVILDGTAASNCTPSRGARFNSAVRYINLQQSKRMAIVISDDNTVDVIPHLRPRVKKADIENAIHLLERADRERYVPPATWLDMHRFYITAQQCRRINTALRHMYALPRKLGQVAVEYKPFVPSPDMDESYLI